MSPHCHAPVTECDGCLSLVNYGPSPVIHACENCDSDTEYRQVCINSHSHDRHWGWPWIALLLFMHKKLGSDGLIGCCQGCYTHRTSKLKFINTQGRTAFARKLALADLSTYHPSTSQMHTQQCRRRG